MKIVFMLIRNQEKRKIILKSKKIYGAYLKGNVASLFKNRIFSKNEKW